MSASDEHRGTTAADAPVGPRSSGTYLVGAALIVVGVVLLLDRADVVSADTVLERWWPSVVVLVGVWWALRRTWLLGGFAVVLGLLLLGATNDVIDVEPGRLIGPTLALIVGSGLVGAGAALRRAPELVTAAPDGLAVGGTAVFGDARLVVADDGRAAGPGRVTTTAVFGDVQVEVPAGWRVVDRTIALFGSVRIPRDQPSYAEAPVVEVFGIALFGDVRVTYLDATEEN